MGRHLKWFLTNRYVHMQEFYGPCAESEVVPKVLRDRLERRLARAVVLARWRALFFVLLYAGAIGTVVTTMLATVAEATGSGLAVDLQRLVRILVVAAPLTAGLAGLGALILTRILGLIETDIQALGAEAIARNVQGGYEGALPSVQHVHWGK